MAANLQELERTFRLRVEELLARCRAAGVEMRPYAALRPPSEQAKLWRQSRAFEEIEAKIAELRANGALYLAGCIDSAGAQHGERVTNAIPGYSWHQWREAVDCFWVVNGTAEWSTTRTVDGTNGYHVFADIASSLELTAGGLWRSLKDWPHVQLRPQASPGATMNVRTIDDEMRQRFGQPS